MNFREGNFFLAGRPAVPGLDHVRASVLAYKVNYSPKTLELETGHN